MLISNIAVCANLSMSACILIFLHMPHLVPILTRTIAVITDSIILGITLWKTWHIFKADKETRAATKLTATLAYNGNVTNIHLRVTELMSSLNRQH